MDGPCPLCIAQMGILILDRHHVGKGICCNLRKHAWSGALCSWTMNNFVIADAGLPTPDLEVYLDGDRDDINQMGRLVPQRI